MQSSTAFPGWILRWQFSGDAKRHIVRLTNILAIFVIVVRSNLKISLFCSFFIVLFWAAAVASKSHFGLLIFLKNFVSCDAVVSTPWLKCSSRQCCSFSSKAVRLRRDGVYFLGVMGQVWLSIFPPSGSQLTPGRLYFVLLRLNSPS